MEENKKMKKSELKYRQRKPDKETELLRMWKTDKDSEEAKEMDEVFKDSIEIDYKGMKLKITGFNIMREKKTNKLVFAYKFKHDEKFILYYTPNNNKKGKKVLATLSDLAVLGGYNMQNMEENLKSIYAEHGGEQEDEEE